MTFIAVTFLYPVLLAVLAVGAGLVVERLAGFQLPALLIPAIGFATMVVVTQFTVLSPAIAPLSPWVLVAVALCGYVVGRDSVSTRWKGRAKGWWLGPAVAIACYVTVALPLIAAGHPTFPGYLLDTTAGFHLAAGEWMLHHSATLPPPYPAYGSTLHAYYGSGYPAGGQVLLAVSGWLSGQNLLWLYFPFQVCALAVSAPVLADLAGRAGLPRPAAAFTGWIAAVPALVTAYAQMGSIKELTALPALLVMGAVAVRAREHAAAGLRGTVPFAVAGAAAVGAIGPSSVAWIGTFAIAALLVALPVLGGGRLSVRSLRADSRPLIRVGSEAGALILLLVALSIPTLTRFASSLHMALAFSGSNTSLASDPGNLLRPLRWVQAFGIWLGASHRVDPRYLNESYALIGVVVVASALGVISLTRRRNWPMLAFYAASLIVWVVLTRRGTEWTNAKVLMLTSPAVITAALIGAFGNVRASRIQAVLLAAVIGGGVLASDALLYHGTNLAPNARYSELLAIGQRFGGKGPTLVPDFDEYTFYALRKLNIDGPGFASHGSFSLFGGTPGYGHSYDLDSIQAPDVQRFHLIVIRRSPRWSRPPGNFQLASEGSFYDVWRRSGNAPRLHIPLGQGQQASAGASCKLIHSLAGRAISDGADLRYALRPQNLLANLAGADRSSDAIATVDGDGFPSVSFGGPGGATAKLRVRQPATYALWLGGNVDRPMAILLDGRRVGEPSGQSGDDGNMIHVTPLSIATGSHMVTLLRGGGSLAPGDDSGSFIDGIYLQRTGAAQERVTVIRPQAWRSLCGQPLDWLEVT